MPSQQPLHCDVGLSLVAAISRLADNFVPNFSKDFMALAKPQRFVVHGAASHEDAYRLPPPTT